MKTRERGLIALSEDDVDDRAHGSPSPSMYLANTWQATRTPRRLTLKIRSHSSSVMSRNGVGELTPAPLIRTSTGPVRLLEVGDEALEVPLGGGVAGEELGRPADCLHPLDRGRPLIRLSSDGDDMGSRGTEGDAHRRRGLRSRRWRRRFIRRQAEQGEQVVSSALRHCKRLGNGRGFSFGNTPRRCRGFSHIGTRLSSDEGDLRPPFSLLPRGSR